MNLNRRQFTLHTLAAATTAAGLVPARAQAQPLDVVTMYIGFPAGTPTDTMARKTCERLVHLGYCKAAVVENRTGAGGQLAVTATKAQRPNGAHILLTPMSMLGIYPFTYKNLPYDPVNDLVPVSKAVSFDIALAVGPSVPASVKSVPDLMAYYKANPAQASMASTAPGSTLHFTMEMLGRAANVEITPVNYRGSAPAIADMLGGTVGGLIAPVGAFLNQPKLRVLATSGAKRNRFMPDVATFAEQGYKDLVFDDWYGFYLPRGADANTVSRLNTALREAISTPDIQKMLDIVGMNVSPSSPEELRTALAAEMKLWGPVVKSTGFTAQ